MTLRMNWMKFVAERFPLLCFILWHCAGSSALAMIRESFGVVPSLAPCGHTPCMSDKCASRAAGESPRSRPMHEKRQEALDPLASAYISMHLSQIWYYCHLISPSFLGGSLGDTLKFPRYWTFEICDKHETVLQKVPQSEPSEM